MRRPCMFGLAMGVVCLLLWAGPARGQGFDWPDLYDPLTLLDMQLSMEPGDLATIKNDLTFDIEKPAMLNLPGEEPILVSIRRKSGDKIGDKVSFKIDINEYVDDQKWHGVKKLSLENGDDQDVVSEGLAWYFHRQAAPALDNGYTPGLANWATVTINGQSEGVYVNVEQVDKTFLKNHHVYATRATWLYKQSDISSSKLEIEPNIPDPVNTTYEALNYPPFQPNSGVPTPDDATLASQLPALINMNTMLTLGALDAFVGNPDALFSHGKNFYWADYIEGKRVYFPWDLDAAIRRTNLPIYNLGTDYSDVILDHPVFRDQYDRILLDLIDGPLDPASIIDFLDQLELVLTAALEADPDSKVGDDVPGHFDGLRDWITDRNENVRGQLPDDIPLMGDANRDGVVDYYDYEIFRTHFGQPGDWDCGDFSYDSMVNVYDYILLKMHFGDGGAPAVPEPASIVLLALGAAGLALRRRPAL